MVVSLRPQLDICPWKLIWVRPDFPTHSNNCRNTSIPVSVKVQSWRHCQGTTPGRCHLYSPKVIRLKGCNISGSKVEINTKLSCWHKKVWPQTAQLRWFFQAFPPMVSLVSRLSGLDGSAGTKRSTPRVSTAITPIGMPPRRARPTMTVWPQPSRYLKTWAKHGKVKWLWQWMRDDVL